MSFESLKNWHFCWGRRNKFFRLDLEGGYTGNISPLYVSLSGKILNMETHIGYMTILLSLRILIISPNDSIIQPSNIPCGATHQS